SASGTTVTASAEAATTTETLTPSRGVVHLEAAHTIISRTILVLVILMLTAAPMIQLQMLLLSECHLQCRGLVSNFLACRCSLTSCCPGRVAELQELMDKMNNKRGS
ncbi:hypothetical protein KEM55_007637, partial [Ascosphaera atra]